MISTVYNSGLWVGLLSAFTLTACDRSVAHARQASDSAGLAVTIQRTDTGQAAVTQFVVETVASGLDTPWALAFTPDGRVFVTERPGRIRVIENGKLNPQPWATLDVAETGESGLMGIALAPDFTTSRNVYVAGTFRVNGKLVDRVLRITDNNGRGANTVVIIDNIPSERFHAGSAVAFGPDKMLYVTSGDAREPSDAQNLKSLAGKVLRYTAGGKPAPGNPFRGSPVYAFGLRNPQGLAWDPNSKQLFATDHGPSGIPNERFRTGHDEVNAIVAGGNYGWPQMAGNTGDPGNGMLRPMVDWTPAIAPSGIAVYSGKHFPNWNGNVFVGALRGTQLRRLSVVLDKSYPGRWHATSQEAVVTDRGRIRAVAMGPDGYLYFTTSNQDGRGNPQAGDDKVLRLVPRK